MPHLNFKAVPAETRQHRTRLTVTSRRQHQLGNVAARGLTSRNTRRRSLFSLSLSLLSPLYAPLAAIFAEWLHPPQRTDAQQRTSPPLSPTVAHAHTHPKTQPCCISPISPRVYTQIKTHTQKDPSPRRRRRAYKPREARSYYSRSSCISASRRAIRPARDRR